MGSHFFGWGGGYGVVVVRLLLLLLLVAVWVGDFLLVIKKLCKKVSVVGCFYCGGAKYGGGTLKSA